MNLLMAHSIVLLAVDDLAGHRWSFTLAIAEQLLPWLLGEGDPLAGSSASVTSGR
jgi:hypothetical protein